MWGQRVLKYVQRNSRGSRRISSSSSVCVEEWIQSLPRSFLRDWEFDEHTHQRSNVAFDLQNGRPPKPQNSRCLDIQHIAASSEMIHIHWKDGLTTKYSISQLQLHLDSIHYDHAMNTNSVDILPWKGWTADDVVHIDYDEAIDDDESNEALKALYQYGIVCIKSTPCTNDGISQLVQGVIGGTIMNTLYGGIWSTTSSSDNTNSEADSAYGCGALPLHTDMTYYQNPPGLQIFTMKTPATQGGASTFADGYALVQDLPTEALDVLSNTTRHYQCIDYPTWHLQASGPIIELANNCNSNEKRMVRCIRHNDLDRLPDLPTSDEHNEDDFFQKLQQAHACWDALLAKDEYRLVMPLQPGDTVIVANQRCMHGREQFVIPPNSSPRNVIGCYVSQDDLNSAFRRAGFTVHT